MTPITVAGPLPVLSVMPSTSRPPRRLCQNSYDSTITVPRPPRSSSTVYARPCAGWTPSAANTSADNVRPETFEGWPSTIRTRLAGPTIPRCSRVCTRSRHATKLAGAITLRVVPPRIVSHTATMRSGSRYGSGSSITVRTTLNTAEVAPMPSANVRSAAAVKPGDRRNMRKP